jgi:exonuclease SbcD
VRVLFTADLQLGCGADLGSGSDYGPGSRFVDQEAALNQIADLAAEEQCELVCILGDIFEYASPKPFAILAFQSFVRKLRDNGANVLCILGNHDVKSAALPPALAIFGETGVAVALGPSLYPVGDVVVATLPWTPIARLVADRPTEDRDSLNEVAAAALVESAHLLGARCRDEHPNKTAILVGHWSVSGATLPTGLPTEMLREPVLSQDGLASAGFDLIALGHIHLAAVLREDPPTFYCGSPLVCSWGETNDQHGVWIYDSAGALKFVPLTDRRFITLDFDLTDWGDIPEWDTLIPPEPYEDANVRVRYRCDEEMARRIDESEIRRYLIGEGALKVVFRPTVERKVRARVEAMDESLDETEALNLWIASQNGSVSVDLEALRTLHGEFLERSKV